MPLPGRHRRPGDAGDVAVQGVGGLEEGRRATGAAVGEQQGLDDLVRAVGTVDLLGLHAVLGGQGLAQCERLAVRVPVEGDLRQSGGQGVVPGGGRRQRRLVGVETDLDVDLGRVVAAAQGHEVRPHGGEGGRVPRLRS